MQIMSLEGYGNYIADDIKRDTQNFLAYCGSDCFFEQLKWFYDPTITNRILAIDDRVKNNIVIFKGVFLGWLYISYLVVIGLLMFAST